MTTAPHSRWPKALGVAALLALAVSVCLAVAMRLLDDPGTPGTAAATTHLALRFGLVGALGVFLLGLGGLLVARRMAFGGTRPDATAALDLVAIREIGVELDAIRNDLRLGDPAPAVEEHRLEVPRGWQPAARYVVEGADPLADLRRTRDQLLDATDRVDAIVQEIERVTSTADDAPRPAPPGRRRRPWWKFR